MGLRSNIWKSRDGLENLPAADFREGLVLCGDALQLLRGIKDSSINCIVTSPPYNIGPKSGRTRKGPQGEKITALWRGIHDYADVRPETDYQQWQREILAECLRVITDDGSIFYNHKLRQRKREIAPPDFG